jgi:4-carboxymuconolactone decarboxylase
MISLEKEKFMAYKCTGSRLAVRGMMLVAATAAMLSAQAASDRKLPADIDPESYSRLPLITKDKLDAEGKRIFEAINGKEGNKPRLGPPANSMYSLAVSEPYDKVNQLLRKTVAGPGYFEICTLIAAREYDQQYEWTAHEIAARRAGVDQKVIDTIKFNRSLDGLPEKERTLIQFGRDLLKKHHIDSAMFKKMVEQFGQQGTIEMTMSIGDYVMTALLLNAVDQQLPPDRMPGLLPIK